SLSQWTDHGIGYGLLRFMGPREVRERMAAFPQAQVAFNYLGQLDGASAASTLFSLSDEPVGTPVAPQSLRTHLLLVNGSVRDGQLRMDFGYSHHLYHAATIESLAQGFLASLRTLIAQRHSEDSRRMTPGDFPLARISQPALDRLLASQGPTVEDLYPLSPLQQGMLFHTLHAPEGAYYFEQRAWSIHSAVDIELFCRTWQAAVDRNPILRTSFVWEGVDVPLQVVHAHALLPFEQRDLRHLPPEEQQVEMERLKEAERTRGFDVSRAPLMRMLGVRLADEHWRFVWSHHHLLLDGWSSGLFFQEVFALYDAFQAGRTPPPATRPPFRDYIAWLQRIDVAEDESFWRAQLAGLTAPTPLPAEQPTSARPGEASPLATLTRHLPAETASAVQVFLRQHQLTLNTLSQAAWALVLARYGGTQDVLFGTTLAGRPPELEGAEAMLGLLIATLPVRIQLPDAHTPTLPWLQSIQAQQLGIQQHQHTPLVTAQAWSDMPRGTPLFNSLLVFENFPLDESLLKRSTALDIRDLRSGEGSHYALTASVMPGTRPQYQLAYDPHRFTPEAIQRVLGHWTQAVVSLTDADAHVSDLTLVTAEERARLLGELSGTVVDFDRESTLHGRIEAQVARTPDADAVAFGDMTLSFRQLDTRANQLARHLRFNATVQRGLTVEVHDGAGQLAQDPRTLLNAHEGQVRERRVRPFQRGLQQHPQVLGEAFNGGVLEQVRRVVDATDEAIRRTVEAQAQLELRRAATIDVGALHRQAGQRQLRQRRVLQHEQHLEERRAGQVTRGLQ
ncbi:MAG: hypothetical protein EOO72_02895, partial [Myxococcaceae bacterium]